jgi:hypothetical protein
VGPAPCPSFFSPRDVIPAFSYREPPNMANADNEYPPIETLDLDEWAVGEADFEGNRLIVRLCTAALPLIGHPEYPHCIRIGVPLADPDEDGLTTEEEGEQLYELEDLLDEALTAAHDAIAVLILTVDGMREYVYYAKDADAAVSRVQGLHDRFPSHDFEAVPEHDPEWDFLQNFVAGEEEEE